MNGYATDPFWQSGATAPPPAPYGQPHGPFDVCVVGAGITGLSTAYYLARAGRRVLVVDAGEIGGGQTARTTAHLSCVLDDRYSRLARLRGEAVAALAARSRAAAIDAIEDTVEREGIACDFRRVDAWLVAHDAAAVDLLLDEGEAARRAGVAVERIAHPPLPGGIDAPCLRFRRQARFDPRAYVAGLVQALSASGATLLRGTRVSAVCDGAPAAVVTDGDVRFEVGAVVVATNAPINNRVALPAREFPHVTYVVALEPPPDFADALYWDTDEPYHYVRLAERVDTQARAVLVGGEDHPAGRDDVGPAQRFARLENWARTRLPDAGAVVARWSGQVVETLDGLAYIGPSPGERNVYVATGDSGMGMTHGTIAGLLLTDLILGRASPWAEAYDPARLPPQTIGQLARENLRNTAAYGRWLHGSDLPSVDAIAPGTGAVIAHGVHRCAVYRDRDGTLHAASAVCPHLGGVVRWNDLESTWDCPVHGSRFECTGTALQGPANGGLAPLPASSRAAIGVRP